MRIGITGHKGFLGKYIVRELKMAGHEVIGCDIKDGPEYDIKTSDFKMFENVEIVIHLASYVGLVKSAKNPYESYANTCLGTANLLKYCVKYGIKRFILASTWAVNGNKKNPYDIGKTFCEHAVKSAYALSGLDYTILRFGTAYGPNMREEGVIQNFIKRAREGKPLVIHGRGEQNRQFTHAVDIARGVACAVDSDRNCTVDIVSPECVSINDVAKMFDEKIDYVDKRFADEEYVLIDTKKARELLGFECKVKLKDGIKSMREL